MKLLLLPIIVFTVTYILTYAQPAKKVTPIQSKSHKEVRFLEAPKPPVISDRNVSRDNVVSSLNPLETQVKKVSDEVFGEEHWLALHILIMKESSWNPKAINPTSEACGLGQALPCSKLLNVCGTLDDVKCQVRWITNYIASRYGNPTNALAFHDRHNWY